MINFSSISLVTLVISNYLGQISCPSPLGWIFASRKTMRKEIASPGVIPQIKIKLRNSIVWVPGDLRESRSDYEGEHSDNIMIQLTRGFTDWTIARLMRQAIAHLSLVVINILCSHGCVDQPLDLQICDGWWASESIRGAAGRQAPPSAHAASLY